MSAPVGAFARRRWSPSSRSAPVPVRRVRRRLPPSANASPASTASAAAVRVACRRAGSDGACPRPRSPPRAGIRSASSAASAARRLRRSVVAVAPLRSPSASAPSIATGCFGGRSPCDCPLVQARIRHRPRRRARTTPGRSTPTAATPTCSAAATARRSSVDLWHYDLETDTWQLPPADEQAASRASAMLRRWVPGVGLVVFARPGRRRLLQRSLGVRRPRRTPGRQLPSNGRLPRRATARAPGSRRTGGCGSATASPTWAGFSTPVAYDFAMARGPI